MVNNDILVIGFYGYIDNIREISMDILTKISVGHKLFKIHGNTWKKTPKKDKNKQEYTC